MKLSNQLNYQFSIINNASKMIYRWKFKALVVIYGGDRVAGPCFIDSILQTARVPVLHHRALAITAAS